MLGHMQSITDENKKLKLENEELKGKLGGMTRSTVQSFSTAESEIEDKCNTLQGKLLTQKKFLRE